MRTEWRNLVPAEHHEAYQNVEAALMRTYRDAEVARRGLNYLCQFVMLFNDGNADFSNLSACYEDAKRAEAIWDEMQKRGQWTAKHTNLVRTALCRALKEVTEGLAKVINPMERPGRGAVFRTKRSQLREFQLHDCIPRRVRSNMTSARREYQLLERIGREFSEFLKSVSKAHLQRILLFFDMMIHREPCVVAQMEDADIDERWSLLRRLSAREWLQNYKTKRNALGKCGFALFNAEVRFLRIMHEKVLNSRGKSDAAIPKPSKSGSWISMSAEYVKEEGNSSGSTSFGSSASSSECEAHAQAQRTAMRELLAQIQEEVCVKNETTEAPDCVFALSPSEVRRTIGAADSRLERLVTVLFVTWGLRIGGLCRLQFSSEHNVGSIRMAEDVPSMMHTTEKNQKIRHIGPLNAVCRRLIADWCLYDRPKVPSSYLFPSVKRTACVSTNHVWRLCRNVFIRAGISSNGVHVHPHAFRHTVIHMMYQCGASFEAIAKWIGHSNVKTTSNIYGRLRLQETNDMIAKVCPHIATSSGMNAATDWKELARFLQNPFGLQELPSASTSSAAPSSQRRARLRERIHKSCDVAHNCSLEGSYKEACPLEGMSRSSLDPGNEQG